MKDELVEFARALKEETGFNRNVEVALDGFVNAITVKIIDLKIEISKIKDVVYIKDGKIDFNNVGLTSVIENKTKEIKLK